MLGLLVILVLVGVTLTVLLWAGTVFLQGYFYTEPTSEVYWQAPAAGAALALFLLLWCVLDLNAARDPDQALPYEPYDTLFRFSAVVDMGKEPVPEIRAVRKGVKEPLRYERRRTGQNSYEYKDPVTNRLWNFTGVEAILLKDPEGKEIRFTYDKDADSGSRTFVSADGWGMGENNLGLPSAFRTGRLVVNVLLNAFHLALWFVCLWLLLRFQWAHALGLALVLWLVMTIAIVPMLMIRSGEIAREKAARPEPAAARADPAACG